MNLKLQSAWLQTLYSAILFLAWNIPPSATPAPLLPSENAAVLTVVNSDNALQVYIVKPEPCLGEMLLSNKAAFHCTGVKFISWFKTVSNYGTEMSLSV